MKSTLRTIALASLAWSSLTGPALPQADPVSFPAGSVIETGGGQVFKIAACHKHATYDWMECDVQLVENGVASGRAITLDAGDLLRGVNRVRASRGQAMLTPAQARAGYGTMGATAPPPRTGPGVALAGECPRTPYSGPVSGATPASAALFQRKIADNYTMGTRAPYWYGVTFEAFSVGPPVRNVVSQVPGVGAMRVNTGAPPNVTMYLVKSRYVVCEQSPGQAERRRIVNSHYCFVSKENEWTCGGGGGPPPQITRLP